MGAATKSRMDVVDPQLRPLCGWTQWQRWQGRDREGCASASKWGPILGESSPVAGNGFVDDVFCAHWESWSQNVVEEERVD